MAGSEFSIYRKEFIALLVIYISTIIIVAAFNPIYDKMTCNSNYMCTVERHFIWNFRQSSDFVMCKGAKLRFYGGDYLHSGFVNFYGGGLGCTMNTDPFGTTSFYNFDYNNVQNKTRRINEDILRFQNYMENREQFFIMEKEYGHKTLNIISGILTLVFMAFSLTKRPLQNFLKIFKIFFSSRY